jgi:hypothetical protein
LYFLLYPAIYSNVYMYETWLACVLISLAIKFQTNSQFKFFLQTIPIDDNILSNSSCRKATFVQQFFKILNTPSRVSASNIEKWQKKSLKIFGKFFKFRNSKTRFQLSFVGLFKKRLFRFALLFFLRCTFR